MQGGVVLALLQVAEVVLVGVGFALEGDVEVAACVAFVLDEADEPFQTVDEVEGYVAPFFHLRGVYAFVVERDGVARAFGEKHAEKVDGIEVLAEGDDFVVEDFHVSVGAVRDKGRFQSGRFCRHGRLLFRHPVGFWLAVLEVDVVEGVFQRLQRLVLCFGFELAFPYGDAVPAHACQFALLFAVAGFVARYLGLPERRAAFGHDEMLAAFVSVPKASVYKNNRAVFPHYDVGVSRQPRVVQPVAVAVGKQVAPHHEFGLGAFAADGCHAAAALFFGEFVHVRVWILYFFCVLPIARF